MCSLHASNKEDCLILSKMNEYKTIGAILVWLETKVSLNGLL